MNTCNSLPKGFFLFDGSEWYGSVLSLLTGKLKEKQATAPKKCSTKGGWGVVRYSTQLLLS
jgi:hypothetical protein